MSDQTYQVIARRWRPKQFSELVGQDHVVRTLGNAIEMNRIAHAYLFVGPRGTGKTTSARLFAKSLNWEDGPSLDVPAESEIGQAIMDGRCLDVIEIDGASNNSVDQVRDLRDECQYAPTQCRYKIYVIDEVHMLSQQAFNALLKTLEEPPSHVKFVFATTEAHKVLPTIVSRCQRFEFRSISVPLIMGKLEEICQAEDIAVDKEALEAISRMAMGGMRDAQSILDQMISFCGKTVSQADVLSVYGLASKEKIESLAGFVPDANYEKIIEISDEFSEQGIDFYRSLLDLSEVFRDLLLSSLRSEGDGESPSPEQCVRILDALREGEDLVKMGLSEKTNFEVTLFRAVEAGRSRSIDQVIRRISGMIPDEVKKKRTSPNQDSASTSLGEPESSSTVELKPSPEERTVEESVISSVEDLSAEDVQSSKEPIIDEGVAPKDIEQADLSDDRNQTEKKSSRQIKDSKLIEKRISELPDGIREIMEEKFQGDFVSVEEIDMKKLI